MRKILIFLGGLATLGTASLATSQCCERVNVLAVLGLAEPGCLGLYRYHGLFTVLSLVFLTGTVGFSLYGPGAGRHPGVLRTSGLTLLATFSGLLLFVLA